MIEKHLGKISQYKNSYSPDLLVREERHKNRSIHNIDEKKFVGVDVWNCYEFSCLCQNGLPVVGKLKIIYSSNNEYIVESKSLKLYLNSVNNECIEGTSTDEVISNCVTLIQDDLSKLLNTSVQVYYYSDKARIKPFTEFNAKLEDSFKEVIFSKESFKYIDRKVCLEKMGKYTGRVKNRYYTSDLLKSNCKVTNQPDWGTIFIYTRGNIELDKGYLLRYIISLRNENHFHEEICEMVYNDLITKFGKFLYKIKVCCIYTRRGGIDICPIRVNDSELLKTELNSPSYNPNTLYRQ